jgi:hypothetical protein
MALAPFRKRSEAPVSATPLADHGIPVLMDFCIARCVARPVTVRSPLGPAYNEIQTPSAHAMGIRFTCPSGHKLHVKEELAGKRGICPACGAKVLIPVASESSAAVAPAQEEGGNQPAPVRVATPSSPSVVIPVVEPIKVTATPREPAVAHDAVPPLPPQAPPSTEAPTPIAIAPPSPAAKYEAQRARARRQRTTIAIVLLAAVIILAVVLV